MTGYIITMIVCTLLIIILNFLGIAFCAGQTATSSAKEIKTLLEKRFAELLEKKFDELLEKKFKDKF